MKPHKHLDPAGGVRHILHLRFPDPRGLRGRQAAMLIRLEQSFDASLRLSCGEQEASAQSIMGLLSLDPDVSTVLTVTASGPDAEPMLAAVGELFDHWARAVPATGGQTLFRRQFAAHYQLDPLPASAP